MPNGRSETHSNAKKLHQIDVIAGRNLRLARMYAGVSQQRLGDAFGITFQQGHKYENGTNRMAVSRAWDFAAVFKISISQLFDDHGLSDAASLDMPHIGQWLSLYRRVSDAGIVPDFVRIAGSIVQLCEAA
jgi:transcriptional regulator with XRE-family HTH domain